MNGGGGGGGGGVILLYHRVARLASDPQLLAVSPENFAAHMRWLREHQHPRPLADLAAARPRMPESAVAVTFDDGYADNLEMAEPILRDFDVHATVFVAGAAESDPAEFFWDELEKIFLHPGELPPDLKVSVGPEHLSIRLGPDAVYAPDDHERHRTWNVMRADNPTARHRAYRDLCAAFYRARVREREAALEALREQFRACGKPGSPPVSPRLCSASQWRALARSRVIEVGAHTVSHARLAAETVEDQQGEIVENRRRIEQVIGKPIRAFSYPFGTRDAFMPETVQLVREAGFACACANFARRVGPQTDPMRLPRFVVRDWPIEEFRRHFANWSQAAPAY